MRRLISANTSEVLAFSAAELKQSIQASEGRVVLSENITALIPQLTDLTNSEIARAFGADLILLNMLDVFAPFIFGLDVQGDEAVRRLRELVGCPVGVNLEPVDPDAAMLEERTEIEPGRQASAETFARARELGFDFVCLTGNPGTGVTNEQIVAAIGAAKSEFGGLIIAGKMHAAGVGGAVIDEETAVSFVEGGADVLLVPAVGTVPGFSAEELTRIVIRVHERGALVMTAIGTSQETSHADTIRRIAHDNKMCGADIQHIGDAGPGGLAIPENIYTLSETIRGRRHTMAAMARSIRR